MAGVAIAQRLGPRYLHASNSSNFS